MKITRTVISMLLVICSSAFFFGPANGLRRPDPDAAEPSKGDIVLTLRSVLTVTKRIKGVFDEPAIKPEGEIREDVEAQDQITYDFTGTQRVNILDHDGTTVLLDNTPSQDDYSLIIRGGGSWSSLRTADGRLVNQTKGTWTYKAPALPEDMSDPYYVEDLVLGGSYGVAFNGPMLVPPEVKSSGTILDPGRSPAPLPFETLGMVQGLAAQTWNRARSDPGFRSRFKGTAPAGQSAFQLTGKAEFSTGGTEVLQDSLKGIPSVWTGRVMVTYTLTYYPFATEAVIEIPQGYDRWWPRAGETESQAGPLPLTVKVRLHKHGAPHQPAPRKAGFEFELIDTTREKGVCLNWPADNARAAHDLKIEQGKNADLRAVDGPSGQKAETKDKDLSEALVTISCFDWGAYGRLKVTAVLDDGSGTRIPARLESDKSVFELTLPKDKDGNKIADDWEEFNKVQGWPEDDDGETDSETGDQHAGDGFTLYEEYRGFMVNGRHIRAEPLKKDLFLCNEIGEAVAPGIELFKSLTGIEVHARLTRAELGRSRIMNRNRTERAHSVDQHGLLMVRGKERDVSRAAREKGSEGIIGTPKRCRQIEIASGYLGRLTASPALDRNVAHELLHGCSVWHHGRLDPNAMTIRSTPKSGGGFTIRVHAHGKDGKPEKDGRIIDLYREEGTRLVPCRGDEPELRDDLTVYVARKRGQHSGDVFCVMRYIVAGCYISSAGFYVLFDDDEFVGSILCSQTEGTGVNKAGREPEPRYGDAGAAPNMGKCKDKVCINDKYH